MTSDVTKIAVSHKNQYEQPWCERLFSEGGSIKHLESICLTEAHHVTLPKVDGAEACSSAVITSGLRAVGQAFPSPPLAKVPSLWLQPGFLPS